MLRRLVIAAVLVHVSLNSATLSWSQQAKEEATGQDKLSPQEKRQQRIMKRFVSLLEQRPRKGTALDRIYGYHVERGTLRQLVEQYQKRTKASAKDGTAWMVLALIESQRGRDAESVKAFRQAEKHRPKDAMASYYLAQSLVLVGQPDKAAEAFERAISRKPPRPDLLNIFQALGRLHQRSQRNAEALKVWDRLEKLFPNAERVQESIATILADEGQHENALRRFTGLSKRARDRYRKVQYGMQAASLKVKLGKKADALKDFEQILKQLNPRSWLYREVRQEIESVYLRSDDYAGLTKYYEKWLETHKEDVGAMTRLARTLSVQGRNKEAEKWYKQSLKLAPSNKQLRSFLIDQLVRTGRVKEAIAEFEALNKVDPNNPDNLRVWGNLLLKDKSKSEAERKKAAGDVWRRLIQDKPDDAVATAQAADLFRHANIQDEAIGLYKKAITLAPESPQYREYLGEYYHKLNRSKDALATWRAMAAGKNRTARNLARLSEVLAGFGYGKVALETMNEAVKLDPKNFNDRIAYSNLLHKDSQFDAALKQLDTASELAESTEDRQTVLREQIRNFQASKKLPSKIAELLKELNAGKDATASRWHRLALYYHAASKPADATRAIQQSLKLESRSITTWSTAAGIYESAGRLGDAVEAFRKLALIDRRYRTEHLTQVANIELRLGRQDAAIKAGKDLLAAAPGNPDHYQFFARLCFQLGRTKEGLDALRRSVRVNPTNTAALTTLASALADQFRTDEAIELYWRAFDKANAIDDQLGVIGRLSELYLRVNRFDQLVARLQRMGREDNKTRDMAICLAQAYQAAGDLGSARSELERLLTEDTRDSKLLQQLSALAESEGDYEAAAKYQKRVNEIAPSKDGTTRLATLHLRSGEIDEAEAVWTRLLEENREPHRVLRAIDSLVSHGKTQTAKAIVGRFMRDHPKSWEGLYRAGMILVEEKKDADAAKRFQAILNLGLLDDEKSEAAKRPRKTSRNSYRSTNPFARTTYAYPDVQRRLGNVYQIRRTIGLDPNYNSYSYGGSMRRQWAPLDYGQARMAALGWLYTRAQQTDKLDAFLKSIQSKLGEKGKPPANEVEHRARWDWCYLQYMLNDRPKVHLATKELTYGNDIQAQWIFLSSLASRHVATGAVNYGRGGSAAPKVSALSKDDLAHVLKCFASIKSQKPQWASYLVNSIATELQRADRKADADKIVNAAIDAAKDASSIRSAMSLAVVRGNAKQSLMLLDRMTSLQSATNNARYTRSMISNLSYSLAQLMGRRAAAKSLDDVQLILDSYLAVVQRFMEPDRSRRGSSQNRNQGQLNIRVWTNGTQTKYIRLDYPAANRYYDQGSLQILRNAYEHFKTADVLSDLMSRFEKKAKASSGKEAAMAYLALSYMRWWSTDKEEAAKQLGQAIKQVPGDIELKLELAQLKQLLGDPQEALALVDSVEPLDHKVMQRRETFALNLAVITGDIKRARKAATRLFGLRLDTNTQMQLATQMHQLGMHKMAEGVLARVRRKSGSRQTMLISLMNQYQQQGKTETAIQIAHQILRRNPNASSSRSSNRTVDYQRQQAVQVLARSGQINSLIERAVKQLGQSPKSVRLHQLLADYYSAAGKRKEAHAVYVKLAKLRPNDAKLQFQIGNQLYRGGNRKEAADFYLAAIRKEPRLFGRDYHQIQRAIREAKRTEELAKWFEEVDLRKIGRYYTVTNVAREMLRDEKTRARGLSLFKRAWGAFPQQRQYLLQSLYDQRLWELPETYDYARQVLIPQPAQAERAPWVGLDRVMSYSSNGRATGVLTRVLQIAEKQNKSAQLRAEISKTLAKAPNWSGGKAMLAILEAKAGKHKVAAKRLSELISDKGHPIPPHARWLIGQELENYGQLQKQVLELYRGATDEQSMRSMGMMQFNYSASPRYVAMLKRLGRKKEARTYLLKSAEMKDGSNYGYDPDYMAYQRLNNIVSIGSELQKLGYSVDAIRLYSDANSDPRSMQAVKRYGGDYQFRQIETAIKNAMKSLSGKKLAETLREFTRGDLSAQSKGNKKNSVERQAVDLVLLINDKALDKAQLTSLFESAVLSTKSNSKVLQEAQANIDNLRKGREGDLSIKVADILLANAANRQTQFVSLLSKLNRSLAQKPLELLPAGTQPNSRQRLAASRRLPLWLVARLAWKDKATRQLGDQFAEVAIEAARRQGDRKWIFAMLRERGQIALDGGDRALAERYWKQMLDIVLTNPNSKKKKKAKRAPKRSAAPASGGKSKAGKAKATKAKAGKAKAATTSKKTSSNSRSNGQSLVAQVGALSKHNLFFGQIGFGSAMSFDSSGGVSTVNRFEQAMQIARMAAKYKMHGLSLRAVHATLDQGPPIPLSGQARSGGIRTIQSIGRRSSTSSTTQINRQVEEKLFELSAIWKKQGFPAKQVYQTLAEIVMPVARDKEVFLYERPLSYGVNRPRSCGKLLVEWAIQAKAVAELRTRLQSRLKHPRAALPANVLMVQLDFEAGRYSQVTAALKQLGERVKKDRLTNTAELVCHVAIPALYRKETADAALPIVAQATQNMSRTGSAEPLGRMLLSLARMQFKRSKAKDAKNNLKQYLDIYQRQNVRYSGDYGQYRRKQQLQTVIRELALAGEREEALKWLGEYTDISIPRWDRNLSLGSSFSSLARQLGNLSNQQRYDLIKKWTMPTKGRQSVRIVGSFLPRNRPPAEFAKALGLNANAFTLSGESLLSGVVSSPDLLIDTAKAVGKLDALASELEPLAKKKVENADKLLLLVNVVRGSASAKAIRAYAAQVKKNVPRRNDYTKSISWADYLVARRCLHQKAFNRRGREMIRQLIEHSKRIRNSQFRQHLRRDLALGVALGNRDPKGTALLSNSLAAWIPADHGTARYHATGDTNGLWVSNSGHISSLTGPYAQYLFFAYPLTGNFTITADVYDGGWAEGATAFGGLTFETLGYSTRGYIFPSGKHERKAHIFPFIKRSHFNRVQFRVTPKRVSFILNGQRCYIDKDPSPTSPWFALYSDIGRKTYYRRIQFYGKPVIPKEVSLSHGNRLRGWVSSFFAETQPKDLTKAKPAPGQVSLSPSGRVYSTTASTVPQTDWRSEKGVIVGRKTSGGQSFEAQQSRLYYHRPLVDGDRVSYEFFYKPGEQEVHPSLGRISFLIGKGGVKLHWITDGADQEWTGLGDDNAVSSDDFAATTAPLNANQWNKVNLAINKGNVEITLNGKSLGQRKIESDNDQKFGFFHYKDRTEARVRNVVLRGNWPKEITNRQLNRLAAGHVKGLKRGQRITRNQNIGDGIIGSQAFEIYRIGLRAEPEARYKRMKQWVLPSSNHWTHRLYAGFSPNRPAKKLSQLGSSELVAPALLLVDTAQQLGKLAELKKAVNIRKYRAADRVREQTALRILIAIAAKDSATAVKEMVALEGMLKRIPNATTTARRWPFVLAISRGLKYPATRGTANRMVEFAVDNQLAGGARYGPVLERYLRKLKAEQSVELMPSFAKNHYQKQWSLKHWYPVSHSRARTRGDGYPVAKWLTAKGELRFLAGQDTDLVYYQMPVTGNFEVQAELTTHGWRETDIFAAGLYSSLRSDRKTVELGQFDRRLPGKVLKPAFKQIGFWYKYRVVVKDGQYTAYVDGRRIHTQRLPAQPDPWIAVRTDGRYHGGVRNLRILGNPKVPKKISLSSMSDLSNWDPRYYDETTNGANSHWQKRGELIVGRKHSTLVGSYHQSLLRYHRPILEDGEISYEFFYQPRKTHVHPALDRLTFLLDEQGVKLHTMTDARYDRSGLRPNNSRIVAESRRGKKLDLRINKWNKVDLAIKGQTVSIKLNDALVYEHKLTGPNSRMFGFFHYADRTEARVRKVTYRGEWPTQVPRVEEQQLAASVSWDVPQSKSLAEHLEVDFAKGYEQSAELKLAHEQHKQFLNQGKEGLLINIPEGRKKGLEVQFQTKFKIRGDFDIMAEFDQLKATKVDNVFGGGFDLFVSVEGSKDRISMERRIVVSGQQLKVAHGVLDAKKKYRWYVPRFKEPSTGGRMRLIRQGSTLYYLFAAEKSPRFRLVGMRTIGTKDLESIGVKGGTRAKNASTQVRLKKLSIHAERFVR